ncbi:MAG: glycosyltransferase family 2 protein [Candidatus Eisenbacteria bacterium]|uniref:Glycosyltransferase family 2 protein n=1 Tax=Eiseniibacteriota bacterium TaxID=2212470 RepID=A0A948RTS0_UNCEI|nr:glycosyltransferase family 2 protein [Candidatus Eisenbacteria bacterium]MBU1949772.1 glycosyltransferase family 2 protein [Candidatus Eisenbacteria bacterium]MBU2689413.1 glycosyltransferase family 2 protein [Candidatus Eisenbacteria bacterium]
MTKLPVSIFILTLNEADRLPKTLRSVPWADEILVIDCGSTDGTIDAAEASGARVIRHPWEGYSRQKSFALTQCRHPWVLWLDADEEVTVELAHSIRKAMESETTAGGFAMARRTVYLGKALRWGGWYPDWKTRLFLKDKVRFDERMVHETAVIDGRVERLRGDLLHYSYRNLTHHLEKINEYTTLWAEGAPGRPALPDLIFRPPAKFLKAYILKLGFLEGWRGLVVATMGAYYVALKYAKLFEKYK